MPKYAYNNITLLQFVMLMYGTQSGVGILTLPRDLAKTADTSGWISLFLGWGLAVLASVIIIKLMEKYPEDTLVQLLRRFFGKWIGGGLTILFIGYVALGSFLITVTAIYIISTWILPQTPTYYLLLLFSIPGFYLGRSGIRLIARYSVVVFILTSWMAILFVYPIVNGEVVNLLPILKEGWKPIFQAVPNTTFSFLGIELLFVVYPFLEDKKKAIRGVIMANSLSLLSYLIVTFSSFIYFGPYEILEYIWPTLNLVKPIEFPFLERFEIIFLSLYLFVLSTTGIPFYFMTSFSIAQLIGKKDHQKVLAGLFVLFFAIFLFFTLSIDNLSRLGSIFNKVGVSIAFISPFILLVYGMIYRSIRRRRSG
ncbi:MAG: endospore germination permease [Anaerobacillus sp.]